MVDASRTRSVEKLLLTILAVSSLAGLVLGLIFGNWINGLFMGASLAPIVAMLLPRGDARKPASPTF